MKFSAKGQPEKAATVKKENQKNEWTAVGSKCARLCRCCGPVPCTRVFPEEEGHDCHLAPVKRELKKEKQWLRRGEYNAAMVKGRQNLELFLKLVAEFNGIELDNSAQAMANARAVRMEEDSAKLTG